MTSDTVVIGGGLAGCFVCWELLRRGRDVALVDDRRPGMATPVAAGLYNPIRFRDLAAVDHAPELVGLLRARLSEMEEATGERLHAPRGIARIFGDSAARKRWATLSEGSEVIGPILEPAQLSPEVEAPYGAGETLLSGSINPALLRSALHAYLRNRGALIHAAVDRSALSVSNNGIELQCGETRLYASSVILCRGAAAADGSMLAEQEGHSPPIETLRGETLQVRLRGVTLPGPLHRGVYVVPRGDGTAVVGSTYERDNTRLTPTEQARQELLASLRKIVDRDVEVLHQRVGLRPITRDGAPVAGRLGPRVAVVNGLGPKGVLWGPAAAAVAVAAVEDGAATAGKIQARAAPDGASLSASTGAEESLVALLTEEWRPDRESAR